MKTIRSKYVSRCLKKNIVKMLLAFIITFTGMLVLPGKSHTVYAAHLEDCDLDGFDDATGVPVPWPGYDETKGDTPDGPGGSKTSGTTSGGITGNNDSNATSSSGSTKDGTASGTTSTKAEASTSKAADSKTDSAGNNTKSIKGNVAENTTKDSTEPAAKNKTNSKVNSTSKSTGKNVSDSISSTSSTSTSSSTTSNQPNNAISEKSNSSSGDQDGNTINKSLSTKATGTTGSTAPDKSSTATAEEPGNETTKENTVSGDGSSDAIADSTESEINQENSGVTAESSETNEVELADFSEVFLDSIINTKGILDITETNGSLLHAGSTIIITGAGFKENIENLEIELHSEPQPLGVVNSKEDGSFDLQVSLPENLESGNHQIVVLYQGKEIVRQQIEVGPKPADSFSQALLVGFTSENKGLIPGLAILGGLFVLGVAVIIINELVRLRGAKKQLSV